MHALRRAASAWIDWPRPRRRSPNQLCVCNLEFTLSLQEAACILLVILGFPECCVWVLRCLYVLAGDFCMGSLQRLNPPPFSGGDLISLLQAGSENKAACACVRPRVPPCASLRRCVRTRTPAHAARARQTFPISVLRFEKRGRKSQSSSYYSSLKENGEAAERERGRDRWREEERESQTGGLRKGWGDTLTLISLHSAFCIPGCALSLRLCPSLTPAFSFLSTPPSFRSSSARLSEYLAFSAHGRVCGFVCVRVGWRMVCTVSPNILRGVFCLLEQVNFSDAERQYSRFQLSDCFFYLPLHIQFTE